MLFGMHLVQVAGLKLQMASFLGARIPLLFQKCMRLLKIPSTCLHLHWER